MGRVDALTAAAHQNGIKVIVDFAANHTNPSGSGEMGSLYNDGVYVTNYPSDNSGYYHHNAGVTSIPISKVR
jgi:glycosidase